jgi:hypothetical protein
MTVRSKHLKLAGAVTAATLTVGALASPAVAAGHNLTYNCNGSPVPLGKVKSTLDPGKIPAKMTAGQSVKRSMNLVVKLNQKQTGIAQLVGTSVKGKITSKAAVAFKLKIPTTAIPQTPGATMQATASGPGTITAAKAGTFKVNAGTIGATLNITGGASPTTATQTCTAPGGAAKTLGTVKVAKDKTRSKVSAKVKNGKATVKDKVTSHYGLKPSGKVSFTLKKGHKTITAKGKLNKKGVASISKKLASGKYAVTAKFKGDKNLKGSKGTYTLKVS